MHHSDKFRHTETGEKLLIDVVATIWRKAVALARLLPLLSAISGCGFTLNAPPSTSPAPPTTSVLPGGQKIPPPPAIEQLTGCTNPNTGVATNDWGVGSDPVFVDPWNLIVGAPVYTTNAIFWTSRESEPGKSVLLTGAFTDAQKKVRIAAISPGTIDWQSAVQASTSLVSPVQQATTALSFVVPPSFPKGVYGFQIEDPTAPPILGLANVPTLSWAIGVPSQSDPSSALTRQVYDCGVEPGGILRVFGTNFDASQVVVLQASNGIASSLTPSKLDTNSLAITIPAGITPGVYNVWVGTAPWGATSSAAATITVQSPPVFESIRHVACSLKGDGVTDNTKRLQTCLDSYAPLPGSRELAYIEIPAGNFVLQGGVKGSSFEVLVGASSASTQFIGQPAGPPPDIWITIPQYFGLVNLSFRAPAGRSLVQSSGTLFGDPRTSGHLFFDNINLASTAGAFNTSEQMFLVAGPDIQVYNSSFLAYANQDFDINFGDGAIVSGNHFILNNWTGSAIGDSQNVIFENNLTESQNVLGQGVDGLSGGSGLSITRGNSAWGPSALSRDIYVGYNLFNNTGSNSQPIILNDGDGGSYLGPISSSTADTVVLANDPWWAWMGTSNPQAASMAIVSGHGVGQYSFLKSYSGRTIKLATPWKVQPDSTSIVVITQYELYMTWAHNTFTNDLGAPFVLADALEGIIEDNHLINAGEGILLSAFGPYGGPASYGPVMNTQVLRNTIEVGAGTDIWDNPGTNISGIGIQDFPACLFSGLLVRDNIVPARGTIFSTNGVSGISGVLIEQNQANMYFQFPDPGFLIQDNLPPPF